MESAFRDPELKLIETFGWDGACFPRLALHRARIAASAHALGFALDPAEFDAVLPACPGTTPLRLRLTLDRAGRLELTTAPLLPAARLWRVALAETRLRSDDPRLGHKTTDRALYDKTRTALPADVDELLFLNERGEAAEGTITNLFFDLGQGLMTPPLRSGCLPGCLRAELLATGQVGEGVLQADDLRHAQLWVGNSLRGLIAAEFR